MISNLLKSLRGKRVLPKYLHRISPREFSEKPKRDGIKKEDIPAYQLTLKDIDMRQKGFLPLQKIRVLVADMKIFNRPHHYGSTIRLGKVTKEFNVDIAYNMFAYGSIGLTVPGAIKGNRVNGGIAIAFMLGPVITHNDDENFELTNITLYSHLLNRGSVKMRFYEEDGYVYVSYVGTGTGNWAYMNESLGKMTFDFMIRRNFRDAI